MHHSRNCYDTHIKITMMAIIVIYLNLEVISDFNAIFMGSLIHSQTTNSIFNYVMRVWDVIGAKRDLQT